MCVYIYIYICVLVFRDTFSLLSQNNMQLLDWIELKCEHCWYVMLKRASQLHKATLTRPGLGAADESHCCCRTVWWLQSHRNDMLHVYNRFADTVAKGLPLQIMYTSSLRLRNWTMMLLSNIQQSISAQALIKKWLTFLTLTWPLLINHMLFTF